MLSGTTSVCVNHPGVEAKHNCRQCGTPICGKCGIAAPGGYAFCSKECLAQRNKIAENAQMQDSPRNPGKVKFKRLIKKIIFLVVLLVVIGVVASLIEIPVLSDIVFSIRDVIGF